MARKLRIEFAGACYHVTNRGNYRRALFAAASAAESSYRCLDQACRRFGWLVHAFVIMRNHFAASLAINLAALSRPKSAREKLLLAAAMNDTTSVSLTWLAQRLHMGATDSIASLLSRFRATGGRFHAGNSGFRT